MRSQTAILLLTLAAVLTAGCTSTDNDDEGGGEEKEMPGEDYWDVHYLLNVWSINRTAYTVIGPLLDNWQDQMDTLLMDDGPATYLENTTVHGRGIQINMPEGTDKVSLAETRRYDHAGELGNSELSTLTDNGSFIMAYCEKSDPDERVFMQFDVFEYDQRINFRTELFEGWNLVGYDWGSDV